MVILDSTTQLTEPLEESITVQFDGHLVIFLDK